MKRLRSFKKTTKPYWLVVSNIFIVHYILDVILPIDELIFFKTVETTNLFSMDPDFHNVTVGTRR
jgi:hypothetical protein